MKVAHVLTVSLGLLPAPAWAVEAPVAAVSPDADTPEAMDAQGEALFAQGKYADAAAWFTLADEATPTAARSWRLAMAKLGANELLAAQVAVDKTLLRDAKHPGALRAACKTVCQPPKNCCKALREALSTSIWARSTLATRCIDMGTAG